MTYGHKIQEVQLPEYVHFDGCLVRDGVRGGGDGAIYRRWQDNTSASDNYIQDSISLQRWHQLKRILKLNNNDRAIKRGEEGYNPCYKYDMIYDVIIKNTIAITKKGGLDLTGDETSWGHQGYGEKGGGNLFRVVGKPGISKGGQTVIVSATNRIRPYWYQHRHKFTKRYGPGFNAEGPSEVRTCIDDLNAMVEGSEGGMAKNIFSEHPHITFDNYFSGEPVFHYAGQKGFGLLMTTRRDRLPKDIRPEHLHKRKTDSSTRTKIARYVEPVVAVKKGFFYDIVHTSFQSTSSCNIMSVNSVSENKNFVEARTRGRKDKKRVYVIEQNYTRLLYLNSYSRIDSMDHLVKNCNLFYTCWKYWHSPVNHAKALAIVTAYDMYLECCEGKLDSSWKIGRPESFHTFREKLSLQQLQYDPKRQLYPGDEKMRVVTQLNKKRRRSCVTGETINRNICSLAASDDSGLVTYEQYREVKKRKKRFCDLPAYGSHLSSIVSHKHSAKCAVCSLKAYKRCTKCGVSLHNNDSKGAGKDKQCFLQWHSESYLGICFADRSLVNLTSNEWKQPSNTKVTQNKQVIKKYQDRIN